MKTARWRRRRIGLCITGASGAVYGLRVLEELLKADGLDVHLTISPSAQKVLKLEHGVSVDLKNFNPEALGIKDAKKFRIRRELLKRKNGDFGLVALMQGDEFRCVETPCHANRGRIQLPKIALDLLGSAAGEKVQFVSLVAPAESESN